MNAPNDRKPGIPESRKLDEGGELVRFVTRDKGATVFRQGSTGKGPKRFSSCFYFQKMVAGKIARFPLGDDAKFAEKRADEISSFLNLPENTLEAARDRYNPRFNQRNKDTTTIGQIIEAYGRGLKTIGRKGGGVSETTYKNYCRALMSVLRKAEAHRKGVAFETFRGQKDLDLSPWTKLSVEILTGRLVTEFKTASVSVAAGESPLDEEEAATAKITADSGLGNARALFGKGALRYYAQSGITLPDLTSFMTEPDFGAKKFFELLPPEVIITLMRASAQLRIDDTDAYRGFLLCMHAGLRKSEAIAFNADWVRHEDLQILAVPATDGVFSPKSGKGRKVVIEDWVAASLKELGAVQSAASMENLKDWITLQIPERNRVNKSVHELRKCFISMKAKTEGLLAAQKQAGHRDANTTVNHYGDNLMSDRLIPFWKLPIEEAIANLDTV